MDGGGADDDVNDSPRLGLLVTMPFSNFDIRSVGVRTYNGFAVLSMSA